MVPAFSFPCRLGCWSLWFGSAPVNFLYFPFPVPPLIPDISDIFNFRSSARVFGKGGSFVGLGSGMPNRRKSSPFLSFRVSQACLEDDEDDELVPPVEDMDMLVSPSGNSSAFNSRIASSFVGCNRKTARKSSGKGR